MKGLQHSYQPLRSLLRSEVEDFISEKILFENGTFSLFGEMKSKCIRIYIVTDQFPVTPDAAQHKFYMEREKPKAFSLDIRKMVCSGISSISSKVGIATVGFTCITDMVITNVFISKIIRNSHKAKMYGEVSWGFQPAKSYSLQIPQGQWLSAVTAILRCKLSRHRWHRLMRQLQVI